ncbi:MAG: hypothetical protein HZB15_08945, partial [Actinobacteria bacterium]|nr:hypothetical protein [Actinomycetota bacterium]
MLETKRIQDAAGSQQQSRGSEDTLDRSRLGQVVLPGAVVLVVAVMVIPLPSSVLDILIVGNLSVSILILLVSMNVKR